jgi:hypothetical protein
LGGPLDTQLSIRGEFDIFHVVLHQRPFLLNRITDNDSIRGGKPLLRFFYRGGELFCFVPASAF